jgi:choline-sulfatase
MTADLVRAVSRTLAGATLLLSLTGCGGDRTTFDKAPVILISIDTLRSDRLPAYGYRGVETPALDALRKDSVLFERAYSHVPLTLPSHASILSGVLPPEHGVRDNSGYTFAAARHPYLPRLYKQAGYETAAFVSSFVLRRETGLGDGFDSYDQGPEQGGGEAERSGVETVRAAVDWLRGRSANEARSERPFFLFLHLYDPHAPYRPAEPFASRYKAEPYDGEIAATDAAVGTLLDELKKSGIYDEAVVVLLSDHGEALGEHGEAQHGVFLYRETLQVPLLVKLPGGARGGETVTEPAQLADVAPTLLALTGRPVPPEVDGIPLLGQTSGEKETAKTPRRIYAETFYPRLHLGWSELASLIEDRFHYIHGPTPELFDLVADPAQTRNLLDQERRVYASLRQAIGTYPRELAAPAAVDEETVRKLAALGYAAGGGRTSDGPLPDPRTQRDVLRDLEAAKAEISEERWAGAARILEGLVARKPDLLDGWFTLALCLERLDRPEDTLAAYKRALEIAEGDPRYALPVARQLFRMGRLEEAAQHAELAAGEGPGEAHEILAAVALSQGNADEALTRMRRAGKASEAFRRDLGRLLAERGRTAEALEVMRGTGQGGDAPNAPADPATLNTMALALTDSGQHAQAAEILGRVLATDPNNARALELLGMVSLRMGQPQQARAHLERALAINRRLPSAWNTLGVALFELEGPDAALRAWREAIALDGTQYDALLNVGLVAAQAGRPAEAREALRRFVATAPPQRFGPDIQKAQRLLREIGG